MTPTNIFSFDGFIPVVHESAFVHPNATVTGNVIIGRDVYIGPGAALRADWGAIVIEDGCNVQESCTVHMFPGATGMNAVVMDNAIVGAGSIVGALCFVPADMQIPERKVVVGNPAKIAKDVSDEMLAWKAEGTRLYQSLPAKLRSSLKSCDPLREIPADRRQQQDVYRTWHQTDAKGETTR